MAARYRVGGDPGKLCPVLPPSNRHSVCRLPLTETKQAYLMGPMFV